MKTKKNKRKSKVYLVSFLVLLLVAAILLFIIIKPWQNNSKINVTPITEDAQTNQVNYDEPTEEQVDLGKDIKKSSLEDEKETNNNFNVAITNISQEDKTLFIDTFINYVTNQGQCLLEINDGKNVYNKTSVTQAFPSTSICKDLNVDISKTGLSSGSWSFKLAIKINGVTSEATASKYVEVAN